VFVYGQEEQVAVEGPRPHLYTCWRHSTVASRGKKELLEVECKPTKPSGDPLQASGKRGGAEVIGSSDRSDASIKALTWFYGPSRSLVLPIGVVISGFVAFRRINTPLAGTIPVHYTLAVLVKERLLGPVYHIGP
jgi:hypothetical protein